MFFRLYALGIRQKNFYYQIRNAFIPLAYGLKPIADNISILPANLNLSDDHRGDALQLLNQCSLQSTT